MPTFGNPAGFLALLAIPAILAIHFLQRESRQVLASTLFLSEQLAPESAEGRRWERLRNSVPMWLQLAAAILATWLLVDPRWVRPDAAQHVMFVLDSTVSMSAFHEELLHAMDEETAHLARAAAHTEWQVIETDMARPTIYTGSDRAALNAALRGWQPHSVRTIPGRNSRQPKAILGGKGTLVFVTDRRRPLPSGVCLLAVGHPFDHCGFCGVTVSGGNWRALVRNYGVAAQLRHWWIEAGGQKSTPREARLDAGTTLELSGTFPPGTTHCELVMDADAFPLDSHLPMLIPRLKELSISVSPKPEFQDFFHQFTGSLERARLSAKSEDLTLAVYDSAAPNLPHNPAIVFASDPTPSSTLSKGTVAAAAHPLVAEVNWSGLLAPQGSAVPSESGDETLVWQGDRSLIFLRHPGAAPQLVINFDIRTSNAPQLPAFILLLHRFAEQVRAAKFETEARNLETNEAIAVAADPHLPPPVIAGTAEPAFRAPGQPCFFKIIQGGHELLDGAAHFADVRVADFHASTSADEVQQESAQTLRRNSQPDALAPVWMLMLGLAMGASWGWRRA